MSWSDRDVAGLELNAAKKPPAGFTVTVEDLDLLREWMSTELYGTGEIYDAMRRPWAWQEELAQARIDQQAAVS